MPQATQSRQQTPPPRRRPPSTHQVGVYLLLLTMAASRSVRSSSTALVPHADGLDDGYTAFDYNANSIPGLEHLFTPVELRDQITGSDRTHGCSGAAVYGEAEEAAQEQDPDMLIDEDSIEEDSVDPDEYVMEIAEDSDVVEAAIRSPGASVLSTSGDLVRPRVDKLEAQLLATVFQFLPIADLFRVRSVSNEFEVAATWLAPRPFVNAPQVSFIRCGWLAKLENPVPRPRAPPVFFHWRCLNCGEYSSFHEHCTVCACNVRQSAVRVFIGQLRKRHSALALRHMIALLCPQVTILHIESHSNREGYEKGAAWLYVDTPEHALALLALHKRVFFDADEAGEEGFWFIEDDGSSSADMEERKARLFEFAVQRKADDTRKRMCLPGQPLVIELPQTSMLNGYMPMPLHSSAAMVDTQRTTAIRRDERGWYHTENMSR